MAWPYGLCAVGWNCYCSAIFNPLSKFRSQMANDKNCLCWNRWNLFLRSSSRIINDECRQNERKFIFIQPNGCLKFKTSPNLLEWICQHETIDLILRSLHWNRGRTQKWHQILSRNSNTTSSIGLYMCNYETLQCQNMVFNPSGGQNYSLFAFWISLSKIQQSIIIIG